jgi:hypothetical protein
MEILETLKTTHDIQQFVNSVIGEEDDNAQEEPEEFSPEVKATPEIKEKLETIKEHLRKAQADVDTLYKSQVSKTSIFNERFQPAKEAPKTAKASHASTPSMGPKGEMIEGFENVRHMYASY